ncbi:MAG TPA: serine/threonine dehydratase [Acidimicrobiia bacterium]|nr:serine/threonine dehydratase [Acidimicrobiia bacterium]
MSREEIAAASHRIAGLVRVTPILELGEVLGRWDLALKLEHLQVTGSFKARGAFSALTAMEGQGEVVAASGGNFGAAVAFAASRLGHPATIFVPETSPMEKIERIRGHGAEVRVIPGYYDEARRAAEDLASRLGTTALHAYDQPDVVAGQGTLAKELESQQDADVVLVAVGGGGLIAGMASWYQRETGVVAVEPEMCPALNAAMEAGRPVEAAVGGVAASSLGARVIGDHAWRARGMIEESTLVEEGAIVEAQRWLWEETRLVVEPAAATTVAALRSKAYQPEPGSRVVAVLSGGNVDPGTVA